ncbi:ATP-binding protein [Roseisolibacter sp. H3M3-2]|uniref:GAF domain-containing sensor histidine kinase n=1 Tax=Roseisolibacter sp. H3M3-2 TaxID=3031323 RepID=UPI0023DA4B9E|nr:ATP-binding protein [Roseisolibacter sp. H3M3-2]MDF1505249.1 ATP-binding protein [Roseisolibacter sp. H3M3-2]
MSRPAGHDPTLGAPARLDAIRRLELLDRPAEPALERLITLAAAALEVPIALLSLVDDRRQFFTAAVGIPEPWASRRETPLSHSFCQHVVRAGEPLVVEDARAHPLVADNLAISEMGVEAYLGFPVASPDGSVLGSLAVADVRPRPWSPRDVRLLGLLAGVATREVTLGRAARTTAALLEHASDAYLALDEEHRVTGINAAAERLLGAARDAVVGRVVWQLLPGALADAVEPVVERATQEHRVVETEVRAACAADAPEREFELRVLPSRDGTAVLARDVTARRVAEAERQRLLESEHLARVAAEDANRAKSDFLSVISHELRTPLNAIAGHVQLVELGVHGPLTDAQRDALERVQRAGRHLLGLIEDLLRFAKLEAGKVEFDVAPTRVADVLADVLPLIEPQAAARRVPVRVSADGDAVVWADRGKLGQVLLNLLANAVKFSPADAPVEIALGPRDDAPDRVELRVRDAGAGIPADRQAHIFEPFVQVGRSLNNPAEGTGLGLAISRDLARGMGAELQVRSAEGQGSTFSVVLRRVQTPDGATTDRRARTDRRFHADRRRDDRRGHPPPS